MQLYSTIRLEAPEGILNVKVYLIKTEGKTQNATIERCLTSDNKNYIVISCTTSTTKEVISKVINRYVNTLKFLPSRKIAYGIQKASRSDRREILKGATI